MKPVTLPFNLPTGRISKQPSPDSNLSPPAKINESRSDRHDHHHSIMQRQRSREERNASCQRLIEEGWQMNAQKERQYIQMKQLKAMSNKSYGLLERSRQVEMQNARKQYAFHLNKQEQESRLQNSQTIALDKSGELQVMREQEETLVGSRKRRQRRKEAIIHQIHNDQLPNPEAFERYSPMTKVSIERERASTEMVQDKQSLVKSSSRQKVAAAQQQVKDQRINQARAMKHYLLSRKSKQVAERDESARNNQLSNMNQLRSGMRQRKETINWKLSRSKSHKKHSLPAIYGNKVIRVLFNGPGEEWRKKKQQYRTPYELGAATDKARQRNASMMALIADSGWQ